MNYFSPNHSSSFHTVNTDAHARASKVDKVFYLAFNFINNAFPNALVSKSLKRANYKFENIDNWIKKIDLETNRLSPVRLLSDWFWESLAWDRLENELGQIHALDVGCGSGSYCQKLYSYSAERLASYTGIDAFPSEKWAEIQSTIPGSSFEKSGSHSISQFLTDKTNLILTQSSLEHFEHDLLFFEEIRAYIQKQNRPIIQIHLVPARKCLKLYGFHGVRQYTPRTVSRIASLFENFSDLTLYSLGGERCAQTYFDFVSKPMRKPPLRDFRETKTKEYNEQLRSAIHEDFKGKQTRDPLWYALVIHSHPTARIFH